MKHSPGLALCLSLAVVPSVALGQFNLERVPEPVASLPDPAYLRLREEKHRLDGLFDSVKGTFDEFQTDCTNVPSSRAQVAHCPSRRSEVLKVANNYIAAACAYKKENVDALTQMMDSARREIARYQDQIRRVGIEAAADAYEQWTEVSAEQLEALEKERAGYIVAAGLTALRDLAKVAARGVAKAVVTPEQAERIIESLQSTGVTDPHLLQPIHELPKLLDEATRVELAQRYVEAAKANIELEVKEHEIRSTRDPFERKWAAAQAAVVLTELAAKPVLARVAASPAEAIAAGGRVSAIAAAAPGAIQIVGHSAIGYFWTYHNIELLSGLEEIQRVQVQVAAGMMVGPIVELRMRKEQRVRYLGDKRCGA